MTLIKVLSFIEGISTIPWINMLRNGNLRKQIFNYVGNQIEQKSLTQGPQINVRKLTTELSISRILFRDTRTQMEVQRLITIMAKEAFYLLS